jgi:hypothetical protein
MEEDMQDKTDENGVPFKSLDDFVNYSRMKMNKEEISSQYNAIKFKQHQRMREQRSRSTERGSYNSQ